MLEKRYLFCVNFLADFRAFQNLLSNLVCKKPSVSGRFGVKF